MNIFFLNRTGLAVWGGCEKWMLRTGIELRERGHKIFYGGKKDSLFLKKCEEENFPTKSFQVGSNLNVINIRNSVAYLKQNEINIIINERNKDIRFSGLINIFNGNKILIARTGLPSIKNNLGSRLLFPRILDGIMVSTQAIRNKYLSYKWIDDKDIRVIHQGIMPRQLSHTNDSEIKKRFSIPEHKPIIGIFGKLTKKKQHRIFLEVAAKLLQKKQDIVFLIVGDGPERSNIEKYAVQLGILDQLYMTGFQEDIFSFYNICDVVLLTSEEEGIPNTIMEAMLMEKPVVAFDVGGISDLIVNENNGILVPLNDIYLMSEKVKELINDQAKIQSISRNAKDHILVNFSLKNMIDETEAYLQELVQKKK